MVDTSHKSSEDYLEEQHFQYLSLVTESGIPLWLLDFESEYISYGIPIAELPSLNKEES